MSPRSSDLAPLTAFKREMEYRIPGLHHPENPLRFLEIFEDHARTEQASCRFSW
jgi:hypothetical protein